MVLYAGWKTPDKDDAESTGGADNTGGGDKTESSNKEKEDDTVGEVVTASDNDTSAVSDVKGNKTDSVSKNTSVSSTNGADKSLVTPKIGDNANMVLYTVMAVLSFAGIAIGTGLLCRRRCNY